MQERPLHYHNFILSLWQEPGNPATWRFSLQNPHTAERHGFKDMTELMRFLEEWTQKPTIEAD